MGKRSGGLNPKAVLQMFRELRSSANDVRPLVVAGAPNLAAVLRRELAAGGEPAAVRDGSPRGAAAYVYVLAGPPGAQEERELQEASRARVPIVCITTGHGAEDGPIPYVLATDIVAVPPGAGFPLDVIADVLARRLGVPAGPPLAARLPVLRKAVSTQLMRSFARKNALVGAAVWIPAADMPVMTMNQMRLVMRLAAVHGFDRDPKRALELAGVLGSGFGMRVVGRSMLGFVPFAGWAVRAGIGYAGTVAVGEAAVRYYVAQNADAEV
jgi:uncharacterized protein (DUF697 family)